MVSGRVDFSSSAVVKGYQQMKKSHHQQGNFGLITVLSLILTDQL